MTIRTIIVAAVASLSMTTMSLGDWFTELTASDAASDDIFGSSVAIDGDTCVIGAYGTNTGSGIGSAYVFTKSGGTWNQVAELTAPGEANDDYFGYSVAIDGDTCVIAALGTNSFTGSAHVYTKSGGIWNQVAELTAPGGASNDFFGNSVAIDGDTCVIGARGTNSYTGSAYVFTKSGGTWNQVAEFTAPGGASNDTFGGSVAIDGDTCVIGAPGANSFIGSAYVYTKSGGTWTQVAELTAPGGVAGYYFGNSVAIDGDTCVIAAFGTNSGIGSAYVFTRSGGTWGQVAELAATGGASNDFFGSSVAIDGDTCVIGAPGIEGSIGSAYVFSKSGGTWNQVAELTAPGEAKNDFFGYSVTTDGDTCVIGAPRTNSYTGSAYVFGSSTSTAATGACCVTIGCTVIAESACTDLGGSWTESGSCADCPAPCSSDSDNDGDVDVDDLLKLLSAFGACP